MERTNDWLTHRLQVIWQTYFADLAQLNTVHIRFGRKARTRLGSIRRTLQGTSVMTLTGYFQDPTIPEVILDETISHELIHYAHGFESPHPQLYRYPHEGRIVQEEMKQRNLTAIHTAARRWLRNNWRAYLMGQGVRPRRRRVRRRLVRLFSFRR